MIDLKIREKSQAHSTQSILFKVADQEREFVQIHRLNYATFVEEIPQHTRNEQGVLVDRFHSENTYIIALHREQLVGMVALRGKRPFSLDLKLSGLESFLPQGRKVIELRLLAIQKRFRGGRVLLGLLNNLVHRARAQGYDMAIISGTERQLKMYKSLGFIPFGPLVGAFGAQFQPMYLTLEHFISNSKFLPAAGLSGRPPVLLLPGPVMVSQPVRQAFQEAPVSHRSEDFISRFKETRQGLNALVKTAHTTVLLGSGTLANEAIAAQLSLLSRRGLILCNGEFGQRLIDHARRWGLSFDILETNWGEAFLKAEVEKAFDRSRDAAWVWAVHCETSTGILNDIEYLKRACAERGIRLCLDCISSLGTVPMDLRGVYLSSGVSGKGLGAYSGLSMVFHHHQPIVSPNLPRYLDLGFYHDKGGIPFTTSSNLVYALHAALDRFNDPMIYGKLSALSHRLRTELRRIGFPLVASDENASPAVISMAAPDHLNTQKIGRYLRKAGFLLSFESEYLRERNWMQICLMGECKQEMLEPLLKELEFVLHAGQRAFCR